MKVYKFGGASIKDANGVKNVARILQQEGFEGCLLVVSAMGKMTNAFEKIVNAFHSENDTLKDCVTFVSDFHYNILKGLFQESHPIYKKVTILLGELHDFMSNTSSKNYDYLYDQIVSFGELLSTNIVSAYLLETGVQNTWADVRKLIQTDETFRDARVLWNETEKRIVDSIDINTLTITQGFLGGNSEGHTTTLGREGSDYTAGIFAYCLNAQNVTIWKDVQGVLNADPRVFKETQLLEQISYEETIEMAFYGASVIHPKTIQPLQNKEIPLLVRSFIDPKLQGTRVSRGVTIEPLIPCFIVKKSQVLVSISTLDFSFMVEDNISHIFKLLHQYQLKVNLIQNSAISFSICVDNKFNQFETFYEEIASSYKITFAKDVDLYTVRHFSKDSLERIYQVGTPLLTQINKETAQIVVQ